jgi:peptidyl-prolyl cis-trans isomerase D
MFDLFRSRAKAVRILLGGMLLIVALSMVVTLIPGFGSGGGGAQDNVIASIGKEEVTVRDVQLRMQAAMRNRSVPRDAADTYVQQMVDEMVTTRAMAYEAKRLGLRVSDAELAQALRTILPQLFPNGQFVGAEVYARFLEQQNLTIPEFESQLRTDLLINRLRDLVADSVIVTPQEVKAEFQRRNQKISLEYVAISQDKLRSQVSVTPEEVRAYFEARRADYRIPEERSLELVVADENKLGQTIVIPEDQLRRVYEQTKDQYRTPERVQVRHILLMTTDKPKDELPKIQAKAESILKQLKAGADFAKLAREYSEDPGSKDKGGDLGWIVRGQTVPAFENAAFSLKPGELSGIITTQYGLHIIQVLAKEPARVKPFEEVKDQIAKELKKQQVFDTMERLADQARSELAKQPTQAAAIAAKLGLDLVKVDNLKPGQTVPLFGNNPDFNDAVSSLPQGGVTSVMQAPGNKLVVTVVTGITPPRPAELPEVEASIRQQLLRQKTAELVNARTAAVLQKFRTPGVDLRSAMQQMGLDLKHAPDFGMDGAAEGIGPASFLIQGFQLPVGGVFGPIVVGNNQFICRVTGKTPADMTQFAMQRAGIEAELKDNKVRQRMELFQDSIRTALIREGKVKVNNDVLNRVAASYRG